MRLLKGKVYKVDWWDITTDNQWRKLDDILKEADKLKPTQNTWTYICTRGNWYVFSSGINPDGEYYDYHLLPKTVIKKVKLLK